MPDDDLNFWCITVISEFRSSELVTALAVGDINTKIDGTAISIVLGAHFFNFSCTI